MSVGRSRHATWATPGNKTRDSRPLRGAPSPSPLHPHPSQVPPAAQVGGGVQTCIWDAGSGNQKRTLVGRSRRVGSSPTDGRWGTDDGGTRHWRGSAEYTETGGEGAFRKKRERRRASLLQKELGARMNLGGGERKKRKGPHHHRRVNIET